jgi:hypothetical protein
VESYLEHFPEDRVLVVDNNPVRGEPGWAPDCEAERAWLADHPAVVVVDNPVSPGDLPWGRTHGAGIDRALAWCRANGGRVLIHFEPDCLIRGRRWRDNLVGALAAGAWMAGSFRQRHGPIHPTPSAWLVAEVRASFSIHAWGGPDEAHPRFPELIDRAALADDQSREVTWIRWARCWDTGHKAWFEAALHDRTALVDTPDFKHYWHGSIDPQSERTLRRRFPEVAPYLDRGRARRRGLPVEHCPFREDTDDPAVARCQLVRDLSGVREPSWSVVARDACEACCASVRPARDRVNPVVAALLYDLADRILERGGVHGCDAATAAALRDRFEDELDLELP